MQEIANMMTNSNISLAELTNFITLKEKEQTLNNILNNPRTMSWGDEEVEVEFLQNEINELS